MDYGRRERYIGVVLRIGTPALLAPTFYAPSHRYRRLAVGSYGFGHTNLRQPGDLRGTVVGRQGRFRVPTPPAGGEA